MGTSTKPSRKPLKSSTDGKVTDDSLPQLSHAGKKLLKRILNESHRTNTLPSGSKILIALSGGPDSTALLRLLVALRAKLSLTIAAAHVNYGLRGIDSERDETAVIRLCKKHDIPLSVLRPKGMIGKNEEALRDVRYRFFEEERKRIGFGLVATAHTKDDQAETVIMRLLRGAGATGLSAMRPKRDHIIRPLLCIRKGDLIEFLKGERLPFRLDKTNRNPAIFRNRIRQKLLPLLERDYQPNIVEILSQTADILSESGEINRSQLLFSVQGKITFSRSEFLELSDATQSDELRRLFQIVSGTRKNPSVAFTREAKKLIGSPKGKVRRYESLQLKIEARGDTVVMIRT